MTDETAIGMVTRHFSLGIATVIRQQRTIATLRAAECPAETLELAERLLGTFLDMQKKHQAHFERLVAQEMARQAAVAGRHIEPPDRPARPRQRRNPAWPSGVTAAQ